MYRLVLKFIFTVDLSKKYLKDLIHYASHNIAHYRWPSGFVELKWKQKEK